MILELGDGRELRLPDEMPDETARQIKALILALEDRARVAESDARTLRDEMARLRQQFNVIQSRPPDTSVASALRELQGTLMAGVERIVAAQLADRKLVYDEMGEQSISRAVPKQS